MTEYKMLPPENIPILDDLTPILSSFFLRKMLSKGGAQHHETYVLQLNAIRISDLIISEYSMAKDRISLFYSRTKGDGLSYIFDASGHFENCILGIEKYIKHVKAIKSSKDSTQEIKDVIPKQLSFLKSDVEGRITKLRHCLAHLEKDALKGNLPKGSTIVLMAVEKGLEIGNHTISWAELENWLKDIHKCSLELAQYSEKIIA